MHMVRAAYEHRWAAYIGIGVGVAVIALGIAVGGETGSDMRSGGMLLFITASMQNCMLTVIRHGNTVAHRDGYRRGRRVAVLTAMHRPAEPPPRGAPAPQR